MSVLLSLILALFTPMSHAMADSPFSSPDFDGDGLSDEMEENGWYSLAGVRYETDPYDIDSDDDGLTDAEEKLFNTDPVEARNPGIYVKYEDSFRTGVWTTATERTDLGSLKSTESE